MTAEHETLPLALSLAVHELRTPLSVALGYLRMLSKREPGPLSDREMKMLEETERACHRMAALVEDISELRKLETGQVAIARQPFDLGALLEELAEDMHQGHDRNVRLVVRGIDRPLPVIVRVLVHAIMRERVDGTVVADCAAEDGSPRMARVVVGEESRVPELVRAASTTLVGEWKHGTGFGLPLARRIVEAHGGRISSAPWDEPDKPRGGMTLRIPLGAA
jgi:signal transduction histidine kinase